MWTLTKPKLISQLLEPLYTSRSGPPSVEKDTSSRRAQRGSPPASTWERRTNLLRALVHRASSSIPRDPLRTKLSFFFYPPTLYSKQSYHVFTHLTISGEVKVHSVSMRDIKFRVKKTRSTITRSLSRSLSLSLSLYLSHTHTHKRTHTHTHNHVHIHTVCIYLEKEKKGEIFTYVYTYTYTYI